MATIRRREGKRGITYDVQVRVKRKKAKAPLKANRSFKKLTDAKRWGEKTEMAMRDGCYGPTCESQKKTLSQAIERYRKYILPSVQKSKREHVIEWWDKNFGHLLLMEVNPALITEIRDRLLHEEVDNKKRATATVVKYLTTLSHILTICVNEWQWLESNPVFKVSKPSLPKGRTRFLDDAERAKLLEKCKTSANPFLYTIVILAIATGMRRSEILNLTWDDIDFDRGRIVLRETKNGEVRVLPLVGYAQQLLKILADSRKHCSSLIFPGINPNQSIDFRSAWRVAVKNSDLRNFRFHDLRHCFASYCVMNGSSLNEVADLLGHKSYQSVTKRYCHLSEAHQRDVVVSMNEKIFG